MMFVSPFLTVICFLPVKIGNNVGASALPWQSWDVYLGLEWPSWAGSIQQWFLQWTNEGELLGNGCVSNIELLVLLRVACEQRVISGSCHHGLLQIPWIFFLAPYRFGVGRLGSAGFCSLFSNIPHLFPHELVLHLAVIPMPYKLGICIFFTMNIWASHFGTQHPSRLKI